MSAATHAETAVVAFPSSPASKARDVYKRLAPRYASLHRRWLRHAGGAAQAAFEAAAMSLLRPGIDVLDAGCGTGEFARHVLARRGDVALTLLDCCPEMIAQAADLPAKCVTGCLMNMPFAANSFDLVTAAWSIETTPDPMQAICEMFRVAKPGGHVLTAFCSTSPAKSVMGEVMRTCVRLRGSGQFLDVDAIEKGAMPLADLSVRMRHGGPASTLLFRKPVDKAFPLAA